MLNLGKNKRKRFAGMMANSVQIVLGAVFVSNFFREGGVTLRIVSLILITTCFIAALISEPEENGE